MALTRSQARLAAPFFASLGAVLAILGILIMRGAADEPSDDDRDETRRASATTKAPGPSRAAVPQPGYVVLGYNDLGMHCMNEGFSELCILPPFNNLHAQVIRRGEEPRIVSTGATVNYRIPNNTDSTSKTDFWLFAPSLFNVQLAPNIGLTGNGLKGRMAPTGNNDWSATGIPVTPIDDDGNLNPYQLAKIDVKINGSLVATTQAVIPVSWEISCNLCHNTPGVSVATDILRKHDKLHRWNVDGTRMRLARSKPVLCASCHADPALGTKGLPGVKSMSHAMHGSHASRMAPLLQSGGNSCYACHPGNVTNCQRDIHFSEKIFCQKCHGDMKAVANPSRIPWVSQPKCATCHQKRQPEFQFEEPGKLYKDSRGHGGVHCAACHGSPHAITPTVTDADNVQAILHQGFTGTIRKCTVCHTETPHEEFVHRRFGDGLEDD